MTTTNQVHAVNDAAHDGQDGDGQSGWMQKNNQLDRNSTVLSGAVAAQNREQRGAKSTAAQG